MSYYLRLSEKHPHEPFQKPPAGTIIDRTHPLSRGLVGCWLFNEGSGQLINNLCTTGNGTFVGKPTWRDDSIYYNSSGNTNYVSMISVSRQVAPCSVVLRAIKFSDASFAGYVSLMFGAEIACLLRDVSGNVNFRAYKYPSGLLANITGTALVGTYYTFGIDYSLPIIQLLINGVSAGISLGNTGTLNVTDNIYVGTDRGTAGRGLDGIVSFLYTYNRILSTSEHKRISEDPYCFFYYPSAKKYIVTSSHSLILYPYIASSEVEGINAIALNIGTDGIVSSEAFSNLSLLLHEYTTGKDTTESFGALNLGINASIDGIASSEYVDVPTISLDVNQVEITSAGSFGVSIIDLSEYASGTATTGAFDVSSITLETSIDGIDSLESFGGHSFDIASNSIGGIITTEEFGDPVADLTLSDISIASTQEFGTLGISLSVSTSDTNTSENFSTHGINLVVLPDGIVSTKDFGSSLLDLYVSPDAVNSTEYFGTLVSGLFLYTVGITTLEQHSLDDLIASGIHKPNAITSGETFGILDVRLKVGW
jgi:hypothetical protein